MFVKARRLVDQHLPAKGNRIRISKGAVELGMRKAAISSESVFSYSLDLVRSSLPKVRDRAPASELGVNCLYYDVRVNGEERGKDAS